MAKSKKTKAEEAGGDPERDRLIRHWTLSTLALLFLAVAMGVGFHYLRQYVERRLTFRPEPPKVVLKNRPAWMSDFLAVQIINSVKPTTAYSAMNQQVLIDTAAILKANPWVREVRQVRRAYGKAPGDTLEIECEYRAPVAVVHWKDYYWLVDQDAVMLPEHFRAEDLRNILYGRDGRVNVRILEGVAKPPPLAGRKWSGEDLAAGLELAQALYGKAFAEEVLAIRVQNYNGRVDPREAHLVLVTRDNTEIRWGRPITCPDSFAEVSAAQKLDYMQRIIERYHRLDAGHAAIDIRYDRVTFPSEEVTPAGNRQVGSLDKN